MSEVGDNLMIAARRQKPTSFKIRDTTIDLHCIQICVGVASPRRVGGCVGGPASDGGWRFRHVYNGFNAGGVIVWMTKCAVMVMVVAHILQGVSAVLRHTTAITALGVS